MELYLVRHGPAFEADASRWPDDRDRPLSPEGEKEIRLTAKGVGELATAVEVVLCSPLLRARQTAAILEAEAKWPTALIHEPLGGGTPEAVLTSLESFSDAGSIALVGHDPFLGWTASLLIAGSSDAVAIKMGTGALAHITLDGIRPGAGRLVRLLQSADLART